MVSQTSQIQMPRGDASRFHGIKGGLPKGYKFAKTVDKEAKREELRRLVCESLEPLIRAQVQHALGVSYLVLRNPDGTFTRATNEEQLNAAIAAGADAVRIYTQAPSTAAFADLLNRALDRPAEQVRVTGADDGPVEHVFRWALPANRSDVVTAEIREIPALSPPAADPPKRKRRKSRAKQSTSDN